jgi:hypothetical protein
MDKTLSVDSVAREYGLNGFGDHVSQINGMVINMNKAVDDLYDTDLTMSDIEMFFSAIRIFYQRAMTDDQWNAMLDDIQVAYDILAKHWDGKHISFRYDFLTLLRVAQEHLPEPANARPTTQAWKDHVLNYVCN